MRIAHPRLRPLRHSTVGAATPLPRRDARAPIIEAVKVGKRFGGSVALFDVSIAFEAGEIHALVGENGAGKTTLTGILAGVHIPDRGTVHLDGNEVHFSSPHQAIGAGIGLIHQELSLVLGLTVGANVFLGREPRTGRGTINDRAIRRSTSELLDRLGASFRSNDLVGDLSVSDQQLVEIARVVARAPRVLIMDEPTASLAASNVERVFDVVRGVRDEGVAVIYISHELDEVFALADRVTVLKDGRITMSSPVGSTNRSEVVRRMVGRELNEVFPPRASVPAGDAALEVEGLSLPGHFEDVTFAVHRGEVLGFAGLVGSGRSALVQSLFGAPPPPLGPRDVRGTVKVGGRVVRIGSTRQAARLGLGLVPEERKTEGVLLERSVTENIVLPQLSEFSRHGVLRRAEQTRVCEGEMRRLRILAPSPKALVRMLSGGNQQKVVLGKWLARKHAVLLLDEPTRGVDIGAKTEIYELIRKLANDGAAIVVISSSLPEILGISDRILVMSKGRLVSEHFPATATEDDLIAAAFGLLEEERSTDVH